MKLAREFIPATSDVYSMQIGKDPESMLYRKFMEQGRAEGMPTKTWQGCYAVAPSGVLLARLHVSEFSDGTFDPAKLVEVLERGLEKWKSLPRKDRLLPNDPRKELDSIPRAERFYPADGLVLHEYARDLPHEHPAEYVREKKWKEDTMTQWNQDFVWFTKAESGQFLPPRVEKGQKHEIPQALVQRIVCCHLFDYRLLGFDPQHVERAQLTSEVTGVKGNSVSLRIEGETRAGSGPEARNVAATNTGKNRGIETRLLGKATYDRSRERFTRFELVALGTRWHDKGDFPLFDPGPAPTGFLFTLAGDGPTERLAPSGFYKYGWTK